jgi:Chromo (CHRromatin Organisation MOdifier) domain
LQFIQYAINTKTTAIHGSAPFSLMFARKENQFQNFMHTDAVNDMEITNESKEIINNKLLARLEHVQQVVFPAISEKITEHNKKTQEYFNKKHKSNIIQDIPAGALVMTKLEVIGSKLQPKLEGPFIVSRRTQGGSYILTTKDGTVLERDYAPSQLKILATTNTIPENEPQDDPMTSISSTNAHDVDAEQQQSQTEYTFERIVSHRDNVDIPGTKEYHVKWTGYSNKHNTWEPEVNFNDHTAITNYWKSLVIPKRKRDTVLYQADTSDEDQDEQRLQMTSGTTTASLHAGQPDHFELDDHNPQDFETDTDGMSSAKAVVNNAKIIEKQDKHRR